MRKIIKETTQVLPVTSHKEAIIVAKDANVVLLLTYSLGMAYCHALGQLECFLPPWYMKIDFNQLINTHMIYNNLEMKYPIFSPVSCYHRL